MSLTLDEVRHIAALARIEIGAEEALALQGDLNAIFDLIGRMQRVDTEGPEAMGLPESAAEEDGLRLREDLVTEPDRRALYQALAPRVEQGLYLVPKVIE